MKQPERNPRQSKGQTGNMPGECKIKGQRTKKRYPKSCGSDERQCRWGLDEAEKTKHPPNEIESRMLKNEELKEVATTRREKVENKHPR